MKAINKEIAIQALVIRIKQKYLSASLKTRLDVGEMMLDNKKECANK